MKKLYLLLFVFVGFQLSILAQPTFTIDETSGDPGGSVSVNFKVKDFTNIVGMQFSINWDPSVLKYNALSNFSNAIRDFDAASFNTDPKFIDIGQMVCSWFDMNADPNSAPDGTILFTIDFDIVGGGGSTTTVTLSDVPRKIEVIDNNEVDVGLNSEGGLFTATGTGGGASLRLIGSDEVGASGEDVCVEISVRSFNNIAGMQFSINWDQSFLSYTGVSAFNLSGLSDGSFNSDNVNEGKLVLQWLEPSSSGISLPDDTRIFQVCFNITGTSGSRSVQFSNDPLAIEIVDANDMRVNFTKKDGTVTVEGGGGGGGDCEADGFALAAETKGADPGTEVCVGISVKGFNDISSMSSTIEWDASILSNPRISGLNLSGLAEGNFNLDQGANGMLSFVWFDPATDGITLADGSEIFEICFDAIGSLGQSTTVAFSDALTTREAGNDNGAVPFNQCDGKVTMGEDTGDKITCSITRPTCAGQSNGSINISVNFGSAPYTFAWTRDGADAGSTEDLNGLAAGTFIVKVTDGAGTEETKEVILNDPDGVQINNVDIVNSTDGANGSIALTLSGGATP
ncbi:MAG: cohesin domain-containing protein, partial [Saprospiraceae bacterium]|nr:cohesin domain-containing protein [Saprospiraceae bacterium]